MIQEPPRQAMPSQALPSQSYENISRSTFNKPLPPSPRSAPILLLERQNQALKDESIMLQAKVDHLRRLVEYHREVIVATRSLVKQSFSGIKQVQDATFAMRREERRVEKEWEEYITNFEATDRGNSNFF